MSGLVKVTVLSAKQGMIPVQSAVSAYQNGLDFIFV